MSHWLLIVLLDKGTMTKKKLKGQVAFITGASSGLGFETALILAKNGAHILAAGRSVKKLEILSDSIEAISGSCTLIPIDLEKTNSIENMAANIYERWQKLDIMIHCASSTLPMMPVTQSLNKETNYHISLNFIVSLRLITSFDTALKNSSNGQVIYVTDEQTKKFNSLYNATKRASEELFCSYKSESERLGVKVFIYKPMPMNSGIRLKLYPGEDKKKLTTTRLEAIRLTNLLSI